MRVGVTGHQSLSRRLLDQGASATEAETWDWVETQFTDFMKEMSGERLVVISSLAVGADQRLTRVALTQGAAIQVVVPSKNYEATFTNRSDLAEYQFLLSAATTVEYLDHLEPTEAAFLAGGRRVVDLSDLIVAVWDGAMAEGVGGTADVISYAAGSGCSVIQINPIRQTVQR